MHALVTHAPFSPMPTQLAQEKRRVLELESQVEASRARLLVVVRDHSDGGR